ncbi:MAG: hypothetical protein Q8P81_03520 [Nanoarchaeota archaeon]|nr:hypothetical protein [Nanoarchaeota archaeon]
MTEFVRHYYIEEKNITSGCCEVHQGCETIFLTIEKIKSIHKEGCEYYIASKDPQTGKIFRFTPKLSK